MTAPKFLPGSGDYTLSIAKATKGKSATFGYKEVTTIDDQELIKWLNLYATIPVTVKSGHRAYRNITAVHNWMRIDVDAAGEAEQVEAALSDYWYIKKPSTSNDGKNNAYKWHYYIKTANVVSRDGISLDQFIYFYKLQMHAALKSIGLLHIQDLRNTLISVQNMNGNPDGIDRTVLHDGKVFELTTEITTEEVPATKGKNRKVRANAPIVDRTMEETIAKGFIEGNRNNYLYAIGLKMLIDGTSTTATITGDLLRINSSFDVAGLPDMEVRNNARSLLKNPPKHKREVRKGKLFVMMQRHGIHGIYARQSFAAHHTNHIQREQTSQAICSAIAEIIKDEYGYITNERISELSGLSIRTVQYWKIRLEQIGLSFGSIVREIRESLKREVLSYIRSLRASCTPLLNKVKHLVGKRTKKVFDSEGLAKIVTSPLTRQDLEQMDRYRIPDYEQHERN